MTKYFLLLSFFSSYLFSQTIYERFPDNQENYVGGDVQFYKDFHKVLIDKKIPPCENKNEIIFFKIVIYPDKKIKYVKDELGSYEQNKCTFELTKEVAKYLTGWNPAIVDGEKVAAITNFWIHPHELFQELKDDYNPKNDMVAATYEGGMPNFRKKVFQNIDLSRFTFSGTFRLEVTFSVEPDGKIGNIKLVQSTGMKQFDEMVIEGISRIKNKWTPANIHGVPLRSFFRLPLQFTAE
ncbi:MAG: energy transducer TonB [Kaistella sp.]|nr:energy transducer TonB [Kaistella sp.]